MNLYRIRHVIGRDNLHRIRITSIANGQNVGNSGEGHHDKQEATENAGRCFRAYLELLRLPDFLFLTMQDMLRVKLNDIPTVDQRPTACSASDIGGDLPNDPLEPQTPHTSGVEQIFDSRT